MIVKKSTSRVKPAGRNVTPMRAAAAFLGFNLLDVQTRGSRPSRRGSRGCQLSKLETNRCSKDSFRVVKVGKRFLNGQTLTSGCSQQGMSTASSSKDFSLDSTSMTMPSGVSSFLLDCLDVDSSASNVDLTISSIEEFRKADNYDEGITLHSEDRTITSVKNSTLLDVSHAQDLSLQQPLNLSSILELSLEPDENKEESFSVSPVNLSPPRMPYDTLASDIAAECVLKSAERSHVDISDPILPPIAKKCFARKEKEMKRRKVTFSDIVSIQNVSSHKCDKAGLRKSGDLPSASVKFFDFANDCERRAFFHRLKQTCSFQFPAKPMLSM